MTAAAILDLRHDPEVRANDRRRGHRFQAPLAELARIPGLYGTESTPTADKVIHLHYFAASFDWYVAELDPTTMEAFGLTVTPHGSEWGYFDLPHLATARVPVRLGNLQGFTIAIERDKWWKTRPAGEVIAAAR